MLRNPYLAISYRRGKVKSWLFSILRILLLAKYQGLVPFLRDQKSKLQLICFIWHWKLFRDGFLFTADIFMRRNE